MVPSLLGMAGRAYFFGAFVLGLGMVYCAVRMQMRTDRASARRLFFASIIYLPLLLALLCLGKLPARHRADAMTIPPSTRRANRWLLFGLIVFAVGLCALVLWWMRVTVRAKGGIVDPQFNHSSTSALPAASGACRLNFPANPSSLSAHPQHL